MKQQFSDIRQGAQTVISEKGNKWECLSSRLEYVLYFQTYNRAWPSPSVEKTQFRVWRGYNHWSSQCQVLDRRDVHSQPAPEICRVFSGQKTVWGQGDTWQRNRWNHPWSSVICIFLPSEWKDLLMFRVSAGVLRRPLPQLCVKTNP